MNLHTNLVTTDWLLENFNSPHLVIVDCRFTLGRPGLGLSDYMEDHIPHAVYFDLEQDMSDPKAKHGGRHPLPAIEKLVSLFSAAGIDQGVTVVAYDDQDMAMASRLWWLLRYLGHEKVFVLDGGYQGWCQKGLPRTNEIVRRLPRTFIPHLQTSMVVSMEEVQQTSDSKVLLDSRAKERYLGETEPLDPKAGHIPGAHHFFFKENLKADGYMLPKEHLLHRFQPVADKKEIIVYCGSGVTACVNILALHEAGRPDAKLYAGSWSDWCSYESNPVATGEEK